MPVQLRAGARDSRLSLAQSGQTLCELRRRFPWLTVELVPMSSPGDQDRTTDLRESPPDFFTRFLDDAVRDGSVDLAIHSAKDLPSPMPPDIDWCWLPWRADSRDAVILRPGETMADLPERPVVGVSSDRRDEWAAKHVPNAIFRPIRGNIEHRLAQLDRGDFDLLLMAACALDRLDMAERISWRIPVSELPPPDGQGSLAITFARGNTRMQHLRQLLLPAVVLAGAGPGLIDHCTTAVVAALGTCDLCLYDALTDNRLLDLLPPHGRAVDVGKRGGEYSLPREQLDEALIDGCRQGKRIVRLKGGDPGVFGRLPQEIAALDSLALPYRVLPGMSSLTAATTGTGLLLTRRSQSRGFTVTTPVLAKGKPGPVTAAERNRLPLVFFMAVTRMEEIIPQLRADGRPADEPAALVLGAGTDWQEIITGTLNELAATVTPEMIAERPGLLLVGEMAAEELRIRIADGLLAGQRVLLTGSDAVLTQAVQAVEQYGGHAIRHPLITLTASQSAVPALRRLRDFDWLVLTSPAAARCLLALMREHSIDVRNLPKILTCGHGAERILAESGIVVDARPEEKFGAEGMLHLAADVLTAGDRVLRLRSDRAPTAVGDQLRARGCLVEDVVLYENHAIANPPPLPPFDSVLFASGSAVDAFVDHYGVNALAAVTVVSIGAPTTKVLARHGITAPIVGWDATPAAAIESLAGERLHSLLLSD